MSSTFGLLLKGESALSAEVLSKGDISVLAGMPRPRKQGVQGVAKQQHSLGKNL